MLVGNCRCRRCCWYTSVGISSVPVDPVAVSVVVVVVVVFVCLKEDWDLTEGNTGETEQETGGQDKQQEGEASAHLSCNDPAASGSLIEFWKSSLPLSVWKIFAFAFWKTFLLFDEFRENYLAELS